jgi:hypothetical protein
MAFADISEKAMNFTSGAIHLAARRSRIGAGVVVSLILHGLLILGYRYTVPPPVEYVVPTSRMTVWLQPLRPTLPPRQTTTNLQASAGRTRASPVTVDKHTLMKSLRPVPAEPLVSAPAGATEQHSADTQAAAADKASKARNPGDPLHPETPRALRYAGGPQNGAQGSQPQRSGTRRHAGIPAG